MKFSVAYVKQHPAMFGVIALVFGLGLWLLLNKGSGGGGRNIVVQNGGPSPAEIAAGVQLQQAQLGANVQLQGAAIGSQTQIALAQLSLQGLGMQLDGTQKLASAELSYRMADLAANHDISAKQIDASLSALTTQLASTYAVQHDNNAFMLDYAKNAQDAATSQILIGANLQAELGSQQLKAFEVSSVMSQAGRLKKAKLERFLTNVGGPLINGSGGDTGYTPIMVH